MLKDILSEELISVGRYANCWREAIKTCGELLKSQGKISDTYISSMISTVEDLGPYMILIPEVAFFHGRPGNGVNEVCLSLTTFAQPIYFPEFGDKSIKAAFAFGALDNKSHLDLLSNLATLLQNERFVKLLKGGGKREEILSMISQI